MSLVRGLVRGILPGGGGAAADPVLSYPSGTLNWTVKTGADFGGMRRTGGTVPVGAGDGSIRGVLPQDLDSANTIDYISTSDLLLLPWLGGCASFLFNQVMNPAILRKTVSEGAYDWTVGFVISACNYEGTNAAATGGGGIFNFETMPITDNYMGVSIFRTSAEGGLVRFRRQGTNTLTDFMFRAGCNAGLITSTASALTLIFNGVTVEYSPLGATQAAGSGPTLIEDLEFGRALHPNTNTINASNSIQWHHGLYSSTAFTPSEQTAAMADMMAYFNIPPNGSPTTVVIGDSMPGYTGDRSAGELSQHTGALTTQIASANTSRIVIPACHGALIPSEIVSPDDPSGYVDRVVHWYGANAAYRFGIPADALYIADQTTRRAAILAEIEDRLSDALTQYPDAQHWYILQTGINQPEYDGENPDMEDDHLWARAQIVSRAATGVWVGVTQVDAGTDYDFDDANIDRIHITSGRAAQILALMPGVVA